MWKKSLSTNKEIIFTDVKGTNGAYPPKPAIHFIPDWYKKMEASFPENERKASTLSTIKKCMPVLDAMTAGYIIVTICDVFVNIVDGEPDYESLRSYNVDYHGRKQAYKHPLANEFIFPKWNNPWAIRTPKGYSCLFINPMHNPNPYFTIFEGLVDTDVYSAPVNFPFVLKDTTKEILIPAGTPICQVIPFKRDKWESTFSDDSSIAQASQNRVTSKKFDKYKHMFWQKKSYK